MNTKLIVTAAILIAAACLMAPDAMCIRRDAHIEYIFEYTPSIESNVYHSYSDTDETSGLLNLMALQIQWIRKPLRGFRHNLSVFGDINWYPDQTTRNQSEFGIDYSPEYKYSRKGKLSANVVFSRRNKDLVDDQGKNQTRTLQKWQTDLALAHRHRLSSWDFEEQFHYSNDNYDETDSLTPAGIVYTLTSYDYRSYGGRARVRYKLGSRAKIGLSFQSDKRTYSERRTYTVKYGSFRGRPYEIRKYVENTLGLQLRLNTSTTSTLRLEYNVGQRTDNFENFYGYNQHQYRIVFSLQSTQRNQTAISFRFRIKDYENYWTSRIGRYPHVVSIDYTNFQLEHLFQLTPTVELRLLLRNYNKVSNDPAFDYHDFTFGFGFKISG